MIHSLVGSIDQAEQTTILLRLDSGITFLLTMPRALSCAVGSRMTIFTHLAWNQESGPSLFGFATVTERELFRLIIDAPGIGPKMGVALLDQLTAHDLLEAINHGDPKRLTVVSGIGLKKAEQLLVVLRHKKELIETLMGTDGTHNQTWHMVQQVLVSLNYSRPEIQRALSHVATSPDASTQPFDQLVRKALAVLAKKGSSERTQ